ncbi:MAG: apolipoprotein N-acyltransferase [Helicobacteraceae bacterium]|nr:apolipoprotein N-acyltransferase [Helicobacteraceae bacterium]
MSAFIYLERFFGENFITRVICTIFALLGLAIWLIAPKKASVFLGFFTGILWFWWIGLSFLYTEYPFLAPIVSVFVSAVYALIFWAISYFNLWIRAILIAAIFYFVEPFGFNWFKPEIILSSGFFSPHFFAFPFTIFSLFLAIFSVRFLRKKRIFFALNFCAIIFLTAAFILPAPIAPKLPEIAIALANTKVTQDVKWLPKELPRQIDESLEIVDRAIEARDDLVILPEAAFPMFLNKDEIVIAELSRRGEYLTIVAGGLHLKGRLPYNSAYIFQNGEFLIADKVFLVPFGEASPLPKWAGRWINSLFFNGAEDYLTAAKATDFAIGEHNFRIAICYEIGVEKMFQDAPPYIIAISNNGWFAPSIEPALQRLLARHYARRYGKIIYHASNESPSEIIR